MIQVNAMRAGWTRRRHLPALLGAVLLLAGCSLDGLFKSDELPREVTDPAITKTPSGALAVYRGTQARMRIALAGNGSNSFVVMTGLLTDELDGGTGPLGSWDVLRNTVSERTLLNAVAGPVVYSDLQALRGQASQAIGLLGRYVPEEPALVGHAYALQAYAELFLAELFCSGIPLSTLDFEGDYTYQPGSVTEAVVTHALALFDTALTFAGDSARFMDLARVGRGRALLALGEYAAAAAAVAPVLDGYAYAVGYSATPNSARNFVVTAAASELKWEYSMANFEGGNGLDYRTSGDPRTAFVQHNRTGAFAGGAAFRPAKYATNGSSAFVLASAVEARLIEAEAALHADPDNDIWLDKLNTIRTDGTFTTQPTADPNDDPTAIDTLWNAGSGGVVTLRPLSDPETAEGRVDLLFRERAFWLFLTGHRQGDLRRLIRQYGRGQAQVYPTGAVPQTVGVSYGADIVAPVPASEHTLNPLYMGCASTGA